MSTHLSVITNSQLKTFRRCQREHRYSYHLGYRPIEDAEALRFGTLWHCGLEAWWLAKMRGDADALEQALDAYTNGAANEYEAAKARALMRGYDARWGHEEHGVVAVEAEFYAPLRNPETGAASRTYQRGGKIDVLMRDAYMEHKTTSEDIGTGSVYWRRLTLDSQVSTYFEGARSLGVDATRCIYDVARKPAQRPASIPLLCDDGFKIVLDSAGQRVRTKDGKKWRETADAAAGYTLTTRPETADEYEARLCDLIASDPDKFYQRGDVVRLESERDEADADAWNLARSMRESELAGRYPRNPDACERYGRLCGFFDVCTSVASLDDASRFTRVENAHQELTQVA